MLPSFINEISSVIHTQPNYLLTKLNYLCMDGVAHYYWFTKHSRDTKLVKFQFGIVLIERSM